MLEIALPVATSAEKKASRFLPPLQASLGFRADSSPGVDIRSRAAFFPKNQKLPPKANGSRTVAAMKSHLYMAAKNRGHRATQPLRLRVR